MCKTKTSSPNTAAMDAETKRQADIETQRINDQAAAEAARYAQERADDERRYQEQLDLQRGEIERQRTSQEQTLAEQNRRQQEYLAQLRGEQEARQRAANDQATAAREYSTGRQDLITRSANEVDQAYAGFDDTYFGKFAQDFVDYYHPQLERDYTKERRDTKFAYADAGALKSSWAANAFGDLNREKATREGEIAGNATSAANSYRDQIEGQKSDAKGAIINAAGAADPVLINPSDSSSALSGLGAQLAGLTSGAKARSSTIKTVIPTTGGYTSLAGAVRKPSYAAGL